MTRNDEIRRIESLAARINSPDGLRPARTLLPAAGQVWTTSFLMPHGEPYLMLVLDGPVESTQDVYHIAPLHRWAELAGPDDVILPRETVGHRLIACMGASMPISRASLADCRGCIPDEWLARLRAFGEWLSGVSEQRPDVLSGINYLDDRDTRWVFKEDLGRALWAYQELPVEEETLSFVGTVIQFPLRAREEEELALAADSTVSAQRPIHSYEITTPDGAHLRVSEAENPDFIAIEILKDVGQTLSGATVKDDAGKELARFDGAVAYFRLPASRAFKICTSAHPDGIGFSSGAGPADRDERA